ncbi:aldolase/citrate lyase family protein [Phenylobacterium sp. J367]|nr:aldolase/citrate lyase family protein [Phenylobacterium sp. J367]
MGDALAAEVCAGAGFDWMLLDIEHAPNDLRSILAQLQALAAYDTHPVVRPRSSDPDAIKQLLDIGVQTLLVPMVESRAQAELLARAVRYPPVGIRGVGAGLARASRWMRIGGYLQRSDAEVCLLVQIETRLGLQRLEEIATTPGVEGVFIGAADLAADLGHLGEPGHPEVVAAIDDAIGRLRALGRPIGALSVDETVARTLVDKGCIFVAVGADVHLLARGADRLARAFRRRIGDAVRAPPE